MPKERICPNESCNHAVYTDYSDRTLTPEPFCPECMKEVHITIEEPFEEAY